MAEELGRAFPKKKVPKAKRRVLSRSEMERVLELLKDDPLSPLVLTALYTGMRRGELVKLQCKHVDLETGIINLPASITKNARPRAISVHDRLRPVLQELVAQGKSTVFRMRATGKPMMRDYVSRHFSDVIKSQSGLEGVTFHCLRHTCATRLAAAGMTPLDLQRVMGHQSITTTMIYVNLADEPPPDMGIL